MLQNILVEYRSETDNIPTMEFSRQEYWSGLPFPSPGDLPDPGIKSRSPALQADSLPSEPPGKTQVLAEEIEKKQVNRHRVLGGGPQVRFYRKSTLRQRFAGVLGGAGMTHVRGAGWAGGRVDALGEVSPRPAGLSPEHETVSRVGSAETRGLGVCAPIGPATEYRLLQEVGIKLG